MVLNDIPNDTVATNLRSDIRFATTGITIHNITPDPARFCLASVNKYARLMFCKRNVPLAVWAFINLKPDSCEPSV